MSKSARNVVLSGFLTIAVLATGAARAQGAVPPAMPAAAPAAAAVVKAVATAPLIAGVCLLSRQEVIGRSKVGEAANARIEALTRSFQAEVGAEKARLESRAAALRAKRPTSPAMQQQMQAQGQALNRDAQLFQERAAGHSRQLEATQAKTTSRLLEAAQPFVDQASAAHNCGLLLAKEAVLGGNMGNDLTREVVAAMDAKATPLVIGLEPSAR